MAIGIRNSDGYNTILVVIIIMCQMILGELALHYDGFTYFVILSEFITIGVIGHYRNKKSKKENANE